MQAWHASLKLHFRRSGERTTVAREHRGPLQMQKPLYPEGAAACHAIVLHPPGGIAGGDALAIEVRTDAHAHALVTTPGAAKWYKAAGRRATQDIRLDVAGALEWLPQENLVFDAAEVASEMRIDLARDAAMIGWDITALGRRASGEAFAHGGFAQSIRIAVEGRLQWLERTRIAGGDALFDSPVGLNGDAVFGSLWAYGPEWSDEQFDALRLALHGAPAETPAQAARGACRVSAAPTRLDARLLLVRAAGATAQTVRATLESAWAALRPQVFAGRAAQRPRIWAT